MSLLQSFKKNSSKALEVNITLAKLKLTPILFSLLTFLVVLKVLSTLVCTQQLGPLRASAAGVQRSTREALTAPNQNK